MDDQINTFIGLRLRQRRKEMHRTLREVADESNLTASFLSQVERGKVSLSLNSLHAIARALDMPVLSLLADETGSRQAEQSPTEGVNDGQPSYSPMVHRDERSKVIFPVSGVTLELMVPSIGRKMVGYKGRLSPGKVHTASKLREPTEEFLYVIAGALMIELTDGSYIVRADESIYFEGEKLVRMVCASENEEVLWVCAITPPVF
ncbi:MAG: helix-turn-helix transcriptional regulator [Anaerolineae bacterium]|nr:helix-turn-helix transcriptional regulator [Anaerolineae bacterium]